MKIDEKDVVKAMADYAESLGLLGWERLRDTPPEKVAKICNGIGPEWFSNYPMGECARKLLDALNPSLMVVAMLHDLAYWYGDGTYSDFLAANAAFAANARMVANDRYAWCNPLRYWVRHQGRKFALLCDDFGMAAYAEAVSQRQAEEVAEA